MCVRLFVHPVGPENITMGCHKTNAQCWNNDVMAMLIVKIDDKFLMCICGILATIAYRFRNPLLGRNHHGVISGM